jgi:hypothetical protein
MHPSKLFHIVNRQWPERDPTIADKSIQKARRLSHSGEDSDDERDDGIPTPRELGLRPVKVCPSSRLSSLLTRSLQNAFNAVTNHFFSTHKANGADGLHVFHSGVYGQHALPDLMATMGKSLHTRINSR